MQNKRLEHLQTQLKTINQFEALFASKNDNDFNKIWGSKDKENSFVTYFSRDAKAKISQAFDGFDFADNSELGALVQLINCHLSISIPETDATRKYLNHLKQKNADTPHSFFHLAIIGLKSLINNITTNQDLLVMINQVCILIAKQKEVVKAAIAETEPKAAAELIAKIKADIAVGETKIKAERQKQATETAKAFGKKTLYHAGIGTLFTVGAGLTTASVLMQFSPAFAVLVGIHLPVAALATLAITGVAMAAAATYLAYRSYHPAAMVIQTTTADATTGQTTVAVPNPLYAKLVTAGLMTSGLHLTGFSVLMQFSPAFALLTGLQLPPVALIALAAVGALLISVAVYRLIKTNANAPKNVVETTPVEDAKQATDTWAQRFYTSMPSCCFKFGGKKTEDNSLESTFEQERTVKV